MHVVNEMRKHLFGRRRLRLRLRTLGLAVGVFAVIVVIARPGFATSVTIGEFDVGRTVQCDSRHDLPRAKEILGSMREEKGEKRSDFLINCRGGLLTDGS